ncbi:Type II inositol 3,4-bisphosphate 4-phosphatase [Takifugu flavidus]|uniref:Type II inositol 3,4-bisphosphate 4-phosphatase n=1 Tax=Takifugu flavidus TaxID=433684 RepID=A0A5C6MUY7_9TELE|nr:Type II inositol 3,4-bisphosphate 4-phosphatase [Takifugu flavidus]
MEDSSQHLERCVVDMRELSAIPEGAGQSLNMPQVELSLACNDLVASSRDGKPSALVQVSVIDPRKQHVICHGCTEIVEASKDPLFLTGVTFPSDYPACPETLVKLTVFDAKDKNQEPQSQGGASRLSDLLCLDSAVYVRTEETPGVAPASHAMQSPCSDTTQPCIIDPNGGSDF